MTLTRWVEKWQFKAFRIATKTYLVLAIERRHGAVELFYVRNDDAVVELGVGTGPHIRYTFPVRFDSVNPGARAAIRWYCSLNRNQRDHLIVPNSGKVNVTNAMSRWSGEQVVPGCE